MQKYLILLIPPKKIKTITSIHYVRASESQLSCRSLNQNLPSVLDIDSLLSWQRGEAAAGESVVRGEGGGGIAERGGGGYAVRPFILI